MIGFIASCTWDRKEGKRAMVWKVRQKPEAE